MPSTALVRLSIEGMGAAYATGASRDRLRAYDAVMGVGDGWVELGDRVFVRRYEFYDQNIGVVLGDREALVIDTRSTHVQAREILADLRELTSDPVTVVVDTHGHFDHAYGNHVFRPALIWGHTGCVAFMARTGEARRADHRPGGAVARRRPDRGRHRSTGSDLRRRDHDRGGGRAVDLRFVGRGHTDHDILISVPGTDVIFAGDLLENGNVPFFADGYPLDWPATASAIVESVGDGVVVPGHGDHAGRAFAMSQAASFEALASLARRVHAGEITLDHAVAAHPFPDHPPEGARGPLGRALEQLRGELD